MAKIGTFLVAGTTLLQPQIFVQGAFFDILVRLALQALASGIRYVKKDAFMLDS